MAYNPSGKSKVIIPGQPAYAPPAYAPTPQYPPQPIYPAQPAYPVQPQYPAQPQYPGQPQYPPQYPPQAPTYGQPPHNVTAPPPVGWAAPSTTPYPPQYPTNPTYGQQPLNPVPHGQGSFAPPAYGHGQAPPPYPVQPPYNPNSPAPSHGGVPKPLHPTKNAYQQVGLQAHNTYRAQQGSPPMTLDKDLCKVAQKEAKTFAKNRALGQSTMMDGTGENYYLVLGPDLKYDKKLKDGKHEKDKKYKDSMHDLVDKKLKDALKYDKNERKMQEKKYKDEKKMHDKKYKDEMKIKQDFSKEVQQAVDSWFAERASYNFENPGASTGMTSHFTQLVWRSSTILGIGAASINGCTVVVAKYRAPGNIKNTGAGDPWLHYLENVKRSNQMF